MAREPDLGLMMGFERYWAAEDDPLGSLVMTLPYVAGGEYERTMTDAERSAAESRERQRPEPATLNEQRKRDARLRTTVRDTYGDSVEARLVAASASDDAALRRRLTTSTTQVAG